MRDEEIKLILSNRSSFSSIQVSNQKGDSTENMTMPELPRHNRTIFMHSICSCNNNGLQYIFQRIKQSFD